MGIQQSLIQTFLSFLAQRIFCRFKLGIDVTRCYFYAHVITIIILILMVTSFVNSRNIILDDFEWALY